MEWPAPVIRYLEQLQAIEAAAGPGSLEGLFESALAVQDAAMHIEREQAWLETLDESDFRTLSEALRGLRLSRGYEVYAQPDPEFLLQLAEARGRAEDRAFFALYRRSWGDDLMPTYLRQTARIAPCVRFDENVIPDLYASWAAFRRDYPQAYAAYARQSVADLEKAVALGTCACGGADSVERELSGFLNRFPEAPNRPAIVERLQQIEDDPHKVPVNCR